MKARLFARLREPFQRRARLRLVIGYRRKYLGSLVRQGEEEAGQTGQECRGSAARASCRVTGTPPPFHFQRVDTESATSLRHRMSAATSHYHPKCLPNPQSQNLFAGVRGRVRTAVEALPSSNTFSDAMKQVSRFRAARKAKPTCRPIAGSETPTASAWWWPAPRELGLRHGLWYGAGRRHPPE